MKSAEFKEEFEKIAGEAMEQLVKAKTRGSFLDFWEAFKDVVDARVEEDYLGDDDGDDDSEVDELNFEEEP